LLRGLWQLELLIPDREHPITQRAAMGDTAAEIVQVFRYPDRAVSFIRCSEQCGIVKREPELQFQ
jgi:hypothetical protein